MERKRSLIVYLVAGLLIGTFAFPFPGQAKSIKSRVAESMPSVAGEETAVTGTPTGVPGIERTDWTLVRYKGKRYYLCDSTCKEAAGAAVQYPAAGTITGKTHARPLYLCCAAVPCAKHPSSGSGRHETGPAGGKTS